MNISKDTILARALYPSCDRDKEYAMQYSWGVMQLSLAGFATDVCSRLNVLRQSHRYRHEWKKALNAVIAEREKLNSLFCTNSTELLVDVTDETTGDFGKWIGKDIEQFRYAVEHNYNRHRVDEHKLRAELDVCGMVVQTMCIFMEKLERYTAKYSAKRIRCSLTLNPLTERLDRLCDLWEGQIPLRIAVSEYLPLGTGYRIVDAKLQNMDKWLELFSRHAISKTNEK